MVQFPMFRWMTTLQLVGDWNWGFESSISEGCQSRREMGRSRTKFQRCCIAVRCGAVACSLQVISRHLFKKRAVVVLAARVPRNPKRLDCLGYSISLHSDLFLAHAPCPLPLAILIAYRSSATGVVAPPIGQCFVFFGHVHST